MSTTQKTLRLRDFAIKALERATEGGRLSQAEYVSNVLEQHEADWRAGLGALRSSGWTPDEILTACSALNGFWNQGVTPPSWMALELRDAQRLNEVCSMKSVDPDRWAELADSVERDEVTALSLRFVVAEFWRGNAFLDAILEQREG